MKHLLLVLFSTFIAACGNGKCVSDETPIDVFETFWEGNSGPSCEDVLWEQEQRELHSQSANVGVYRCISYEETISESRQILEKYGIPTFETFLANHGHATFDPAYSEGRCFVTKEAVNHSNEQSSCEQYNGLDVVTIHEDYVQTALAIPELSFFEFKWNSDLVHSNFYDNCENQAADVDILKRREGPFYYYDSAWVYTEVCNLSSDSIDNAIASAEAKDLAIIDYACGEFSEIDPSLMSCETGSTVLMLKLDNGEDAIMIEEHWADDFQFIRYRDSPEVRWSTCPSE